LAVLDSGKNLITKITEIIKSENVEAVVLGLPLNMDDSIGPQARLVRNFADRLKKHIEIPIFFHDERLSSFAADEKLAPAEFTRKKKKSRLDAVAAADILQSFLENKENA
jgi:putative Holliday junction resolvase